MSFDIIICRRMCPKENISLYILHMMPYQKGCIAPVSIITGKAKGSLAVKAMEKLNNYPSIAFNTGEPFLSLLFITLKRRTYEKDNPKISTTYPGIF